MLGELGDIFSGAWDMAEESASSVRPTPGRRRRREEKRQLERIDKVIANVMSRLVMSHRQLMAALFGKVASNPDRGLLEARIVLAVAGGLMEKQEKNGEEQRSSPSYLPSACSVSMFRRVAADMSPSPYCAGNRRLCAMASSSCTSNDRGWEVSR